MDVVVNITEGLERKVSVQIPEERVANEVQSRINELLRTARVDGFRPGKVPLRVVKQRFGSQVRREVVGDLLRESFNEAVTQQQLRPAGEPVIDPLQAAFGQGLSYTATFDVYPEITLQPFEQLQVEKPVCDVADADIDKMIESLRRQRHEWRDVEHAAGPNDRLVIAFEGTVAGEQFAGGSAENFVLDLGQRRLIEGFEEGLIGVTPGERRDLRLTFPKDYGKEDLAGKEAVFAVTVGKVQEMVLPELDAEFFAAFGVADADEVTFRGEVLANMLRERDRRLEQRLKQEVLAKLAQANPVELPRALVAQEAARLLQQTKQMLLAQGMPPASVENMTQEMVIEQARRRIHLGLLVGEVIKQAGLQPDAAQVRERIDALAARYEDPAQVVAWYYQDPARRTEIEAQCLEDDALHWICARAQVVETVVTFDALTNNGQTDQGH